MKKSHLFGAVCTCLLIVVTTSTYAVGVSGQGTWETTLLPRSLDGDSTTAEAYYDTALDITWLADTKLAESNLFGATYFPAAPNGDGTMEWGVAHQWIAAMNADGGTGYLGYDSWRMPSFSPVNGSSLNLAFSNDGSTDIGHANGTGWVDGFGNPVSEMGHMYYINLGNYGFCEPVNNTCDQQANVNTGHLWGLTNTGPFSNLMADHYWNPLGQDVNDAWSFNFYGGDQNLIAKSLDQYVWAVHDGDIGAAVVPIPAAVWLFGSGLMGLIGISRRKKGA